MDDLSGLEWTAKPQAKKPPVLGSYSAFSSLKPSPPISRGSTPLNGVQSNPLSKPATPANDSFSNLVPFASSATAKSPSLQEQQQRALEQKARLQPTLNGSDTGLHSSADEQFWNNMGSGRSTPIPQPAGHRNQGDITEFVQDEKDTLAAFNHPAKLGVPNPTNVAISLHTKSLQFEDDDDDPFGLNQLKPAKVSTSPQTAGFDDDDVLGLLGKPVSEIRRPSSPPENMSHVDEALHPQAKAVAELVDMGFSAEKARHALENTESGLDVQAAVSWLLNQAHSESRQKVQRPPPKRPSSPIETAQHLGEGRRSRPKAEIYEDTWQEDGSRSVHGRARQEFATSTRVEKDPAQKAAEIGSTFLKTAGTLWKQGSKRVQQAVQDFNSDSDSSQPRWMREVDGKSSDGRRSDARDDEFGAVRRRRRSSATHQSSSATDEALMLESDQGRPAARKALRPRQEFGANSSADTSRDHSPAVPSRLRESIPAKPAFLRHQQQAPSAPSQKKLSRQTIEDEASLAYVSSARRKKPSTAAVANGSEPELLENVLQKRTAGDTTMPTRPPKTVSTNPIRQPSAPVVVRTSAPSRTIPSVSAIALKSSHSHREAGNQHFKRGDFSSAHESYTSALSPLPPSHPITIILLTNRALTALKIGNPKVAIDDSDKALSTIGPSKGESETIDLATSNGETSKPMREYYGKALMRKAEALEQLERWTEAASVWRDAVEGGHGGATSIQGRLRAEKAANPPPKAAAAATTPKSKAPVRRTPPARSALQELSGTSPSARQTAESEAVSRLRAANAAAENLDDERFRLSDDVSAKVTAWKGGKADNLRALLGSLDNVLWPDAGWTKVGMSELVLPAKVKIVYMKGIAKVHPDKIPTTATTEQRMIAGAVFSSLNEAWDKFKAENGL